MNAPRFSDEQLSAWVDGEGTPGERAEIEAWLRAHPDQAARIEAWAKDRLALGSAFASVIDEPVPEHLVAVVQGGSAGHGGRRGRGGWRAWADGPVWRLAAAVGTVFVLGAAAGGTLAWQWQERVAVARARTSAVAAAPAPQGWLQRAAFAHSVYTPEPRHAVEVRAQEEHLSRWLTRRIEAPVKLFDLRAMGFELVGGRLLPDGPGKSAQLMYQNTDGKRVTVYLRKPEPGTDTAFRYEQQGKLGMFYWVEEKTGFALVGELPKERLLAMAKSIYDQDTTLPPPSLVAPGAASVAASGANSGAAGGVAVGGASPAASMASAPAR